jgi:proteasome-associated ATPase
MEMSLVFRHLTAVGDGAPPIDEKVGLVRSIRERGEEADRLLDDTLVRKITTLTSSLMDAETAQRKLAKMVDRLTSPPWHAAVFLAMTATRRGEAALVHVANGRRIVAIEEGLDISGLRPGDEVLLGPELNVIVDSFPDCTPRVGEAAEFDRMTPDGRVVLRYRDEELLVSPGGAFDAKAVKAGDTVRWDRDLRMAFERIERSMGDDLFLEETPEQRFEDIGGLDDAIEDLKRWIWIHRDHPDTARKYHLRRRKGTILVGPPGNGKTMLARAFARYLAELSSSGRCRFMNIKPSALHSMWFSRSEANYREAFRVARENGAAEPEVPVVVFFDEVDSVGLTRGGPLSHVDDRVMDALMAELDGLESRGNVIVLAASNRADALDPALLRPERLGDDLVHVPRPDRKAAAEIFGKYLHSAIPLDGDFDGGEKNPHGALIDSVLARIYSSNGVSVLATMKFRDGTERPVKAADLISGAVISKIVNDAVERACLREIEIGECGVRLADLLSAVDDEFERVMRFLTPRNCAKHIDDLPQDIDVVSIRPADRRVRQPHRYLSVN